VCAISPAGRAEAARPAGMLETYPVSARIKRCRFFVLCFKKGGYTILGFEKSEFLDLFAGDRAMRGKQYGINAAFQESG
jgi:hypothetical protein